MAGGTPRYRFATVVFGLVMLAAVLAVIPATAPMGTMLCLLLVIPAIVGLWRVRRAPAGTRRRSIAALVVAPMFLLVGAGVVAAGQPPRPPVTAVAVAAPAVAPAAVPAPAPATVTPLTADPTTAPPVTPAPAVAPAAVAPQAAVAQPLAPRPAATRVAVAKPAAPAPKPAPQPVVAAPKPAAGSSCGANSYINSSGNCVPRPVAAASAPSGATAQCKDGTYSFSQHRSGTCSGHGGVSRWL